MRAKVLSLEQIFAVIENPGHNLSSRKEFIDIIKNNLCESLLANSVSSDKIVFELSLSIFVALLNNFKEHLKTEIGLFLEQVFLKILNSENASYHHKILVLEVLNRITQNCVTTIELFINYDCDVDSTDIFARIIESLARIAQGTRQETAQQENSLKIVALQTLTEIVKSQVAWLESERAQTSSIVDTGTTQESELDETMNDFGSEIAPVDKFEKSKQLKTDLSRAIAKFNFKPKLGLNFLNQMGHLDKENALEVAQFLKNTEGLSKTAIGEYIGSENPYQKQVLSEFTNLHDFVDLFFTKAIRQYLSAFRLPGESQIIDRIMEMFAEKYCKDNPNCAFENATAAYVLAYATIMLQTDAHNPQVKNKMTLDGFCSINRGINDGQDLERDFLSQIYTDIIENPITLLEDDKLRAKERKPSDVQKPDMYAQETENILRESTAAFKNAKLSTYHTVSSSDSVRPMLESLWHPLLAVFSIVLEEAEERRFWNMCLEGYMSCVRICAFFNMELQIESFICSLAKFTMMEQFREEITDKNIECAKALLNIAKTDYNSLRSSWIHILKCISRLDYLHIIQSGIRTDAELFGTGISDTEIRCSEIQQINPSEIDYIFNVSSQLDDHSIVEFVKNLVEVAKSELWSANPRIFSLQELISVAGVNMSRIRFIWAQMWKHLQSFFCEVLLHSNNQVAFFSVDALRQLSIKFLQKEELSNYTFQKEFLYPFEMTVKQSTSNEVKGLVVSCMLNIVLSLVHNIKSGWKSIFEIFKMAAKDQNAEIIRESFQAVSKIVENHLSYTYEHFFELIDCLISFSKNYIEEISIGAINSLQVCASEYSTGKVQTEVWFALLSGLANLVLDLREPIQSKALDTLFNILQFTEFDNEQWKTIYSGVLVPLFDDIQYCPQETRKTKQEIKWIKTTCQQALISLCELISVKYKDLEFIVSDFLTLLKKSVENSHEVIAQVSLDILKHLIMVCGGKLNVDLWHQIAGHYEELFTSTAPQHLLTEEIDLEDLENQKHVALNFSVDKSVNQCVIQLRLVTSIKDITEMHYGKIPQEDMMKILNAVEHSYRFAQTFNSQVILRYKLWKNGFMEEMRNLPGLLKQEKESLNVYLTLLFRMLIELEADDQKAIKERLKDI